MAVSLRLRVALTALSAAAVIAFAVAAVTSSGAAVARRSGPNRTQLILRLHDLPPGYLNVELVEEQEDRVHCAPLTHPNDTPPKLAKFVIRFHPKGCIGAYSRLFTLPGESPGPEIVGTGVMAMASHRAAAAAWTILPELLGRLLDDRPPREVSPTEKVGSSTKLFHTNDLPRIYAKAGHRASFLVWRSGTTLAAIEVIGSSFAEDDQLAVELARRQQAHIRAPTQYTWAERFDGEVPLDDPALEAPVYWLGRNFKPGHGVPPNRLFDAYAPTKSSEEAPGAVLRIRYQNLGIDSWTQASWGQYSGTDIARAITSWPCTEARTVELPGGSATIYGGYAKDFRQCPKRAPDAFMARVYLGGMIIVVNAPPCVSCVETASPYGSFAGMEAVVRGLRLRPKPNY